MRRAICSFGSLILISSITFSTIACAPRQNHQVLLEIQTHNPGSAIVQAYREVVNRYNQDRPNNPRWVKLIVTPMNSLKDKIANGLPLPNLYLAYPEAMSTYDILLQLRDNQRGVVNIAEIINWDDGITCQWWNTEDDWIKSYLDNGKKINPNGLTGDKTLDEVTQGNNSYRPFINSFLRESLIPGKTENSIFMYSAPIAKSNFIGVVNLRLLNELVTSVLGPQAKLKIVGKNDNEIRNPYFIKNIKASLKDLKINNSDNHYPISSRNRYKNDLDLTFGAFLNHHFAGLKTSFEIQKFLGDLSNVEILLSIYWNLVGQEEGNTQDKWIKTLGYATDDVNATIGLMQGQLAGNFKQITSWDPKQPYILSVDTRNQKLRRGFTDFIDFIRWGNNHKGLNADSGIASDHGNGGLGLKTNSIAKDYYSNQWIKQGMLLYYGSSSGVKYLTGEKANQVHIEDIMFAPIPVYEDTSKIDNWSMLFRQQGAGLGMFRDSSVIKNQIAIDFLNYFLSPQVNVEFAIQAGYLPTNYNAYYSWGDCDGKISHQKGLYYQELLKGNKSRVKGAVIIQNLVDQLAEQKIKLWITEPSPFAESVNFQILQPWFQKYYKTFFDNGPKSENLTWEQYEKDFHKEARRVINSILPGISHLRWNDTIEE